MRPTKTDQGRDALRTHGAGLAALERRVLIVSNGDRTREEIVAMLGGEARAALERLLRDGFLRDAAAPAGGNTAATVATPAPPITGTTAAMPAAAPPRRSVVAAKLYMLDMLQLQRGADAAAIAASLRSSRDAEDIAYQIAAALDHVRCVAAASYGERIGVQLAEVAPPELLALIESNRAIPNDAVAA